MYVNSTWGPAATYGSDEGYRTLGPHIITVGAAATSTPPTGQVEKTLVIAGPIMKIGVGMACRCPRVMCLNGGLRGYI